MDVVTFSSSDLLTAVIALIGAGWGMMKFLFMKHEQNLNSKLEPIKDVLHDVKKLELEQIRMDSKIALTYATKEELVRAEDKHAKVVERIFGLLESMNAKLDGKVDKSDLPIRREPRE